MRLGLALSSALTAACGFSAPRASQTPPDADPPPPPDVGCISLAAQIDTCLLPISNAFPLMLDGDYTIDTDTGILKNAMGIVTPIVSTVAKTRGIDVRVLVATAVTLTPNAKLRAIGSRGLALFSRGAITLQSQSLIDVSNGGAGARLNCGADDAVVGMAGASGAGGGGGGAFGASGADGGEGNSDTPVTAGGAGGKAALALPAGPGGGCPGARGGQGDDPMNPGGAGGKGGGTVYVMSLMSIGISTGAGINAGGGGGGGGDVNVGNGESGGGGGGSGGSIFLESPVIRSEGALAANGGGGGEGSSQGTAGNPGEPGKLGLMPAQGGKSAASEGADGGDGGNGATPAGQTPTQLKKGGGGGGGSVGFIRVTSADAQLGTLVSPPVK